jgi:hypothetical protein
VKRNEIWCDICGCVVARKYEWFSRYDVIMPYIEVPYHYQGMSSDNYSVPSKTTKHICNNCMERFVFKAIDDKKDQAK